MTDSPEVVALRMDIARASRRAKNNPGDPGAADELARARERFAVGKVLEAIRVRLDGIELSDASRRQIADALLRRGIA